LNNERRNKPLSCFVVFAGAWRLALDVGLKSGGMTESVCKAADWFCLACVVIFNRVRYVNLAFLKPNFVLIMQIV